jgi:hypothetical protein
LGLVLRLFCTLSSLVVGGMAEFGSGVPSGSDWQEDDISDDGGGAIGRM